MVNTQLILVGEMVSVIWIEGILIICLLVTRFMTIWSRVHLCATSSS